MKVRTRWTYGYFKDDTFEEVVEVDDGLDEDAMKDAVMDAIWAEGNLPLHPVKSEYPGDPVEEFVSFTVVDDATPATIPSSEVPPVDRHRIEVIHSRWPDEGCEVRVFVDGQLVPSDVYDIDPGRGYVRSDWDETTDSLCTAASREVAEQLRPLRDEAADSSPYVQDAAADDGSTPNG